MTQKFWMVSGKKSAPTVRHATREAAEAEADRLAESHIGDLFYVMEAVSEHGAYASVTRSDMEEPVIPVPELREEPTHAPTSPGEMDYRKATPKELRERKVDV